MTEEMGNDLLPQRLFPIDLEALQSPKKGKNLRSILGLVVRHADASCSPVVPGANLSVAPRSAQPARSAIHR